MANPFEEYAQEEAPPQGQAQQVADAGSGNPFADYAGQDSQPLQAQTPQLDTRTPEAPKPGTSDNPFQGIITFSEKMNEAREVGKYGFRDSALGHAIRNGKMTLEEAESQIKADDRFAQMSNDLTQYEKDSALPWLTGIAVSTAKQLPMVEASLVPLAGGAAVGGGLVAATGVGAAIAVPVGATTGAAAVGGWTSDMVKGQEYLRYRREGMSHEAADWASTIEGHFQGALAGIRFGTAAKVPVTTAKNILAAHAESIGHMLVEGTKFAGQQIAISEAGTVGKLITDAIAGTVSKTPSVVPTMESAAAEFTNTFNETLKGSIGMFAGLKAGGKVAGMTLQKVFKKAHDEHLSKQQEKLQAIKDAEQADLEKKAEANTTPDKQDNAKSPPSKSAIEKARIAEERLKKRIAAENEVHRIIEAASSRFYTSTGESRLQEVNRIQRIFKRMVKNSSLLDDKAKADLLARTIDIDGVAALLKRGEKFIEDQWGKEYANAMAEAKTKLYGAIKSGQVKGKKAALPPEAQQSLKWYQEFFAEPKIAKEKDSPKRAAGEAQEQAREAALKKARDYVEHGMAEEQKRLDEQVNKLESDELAEIFNEPASLLEKSRIAMQAQRYFSNGFDQAGVLELAAEIQELADHGKQTFLEDKKAEGQRLLNARAEIIESVQGIKPVKPSTEIKPPKEMKLAEKVLNSMRRNESALWDKLLQDLHPEKREKVVSKILSMTKAENLEHEIVRESSEKLAKVYTDAAGNLREARRLIQAGADKNNRVSITYTDAADNPITERHTINELAYLYMAMDDPGAVPGLIKGNGYTLEGMVETGQTSTQEAVRSILENHEGGKYLKMADAVKEFYRWFAPKVANHYLKEKGVTLPTDENYSGQIFHRQIERIKSAGDLLQAINQAAQRSLDPSSIKERSNSKMPIKLVDPFRQVQSHQNEMAFWIANSEKARELSFIFSDTSKDGLREIIEHKLGEEYMQLIDARLAFQFHLKPGILDIADRPLQDIRSKFSVSILGGRPDQRLKQLSGIYAPLKTNTWAEWSEGLVKSQTDKKAVAEYLAHSELYRERQQYTVSQVMQLTTKKNFLDRLTGGRSFEANKLFMSDMHFGDGIAAKIGGFIEYNRLRKTMSAEEAAIGADSLVDQTQASSRTGQKTPNEFKKGQSALNAAFQKEATQGFNRQAGAVRDAIIHRDKASIDRAVRVWTSVVAGQVLFETLNNTPAFLVGDDKEKGQAYTRIALAGIFGAVGRIPGLGWDVAAIVRGEAPRTISGSIAGDASKFFKKAWKVARDAAEGNDIEIDGDTAWTTLKAAGLAQGWWTGIPIYPLLKYTELGSKAVKKVTGEE